MRRVSLMFALALATTLSLGAGDSDPPAGHAVHAEKTVDTTTASGALAKENADSGKSSAGEQSSVERALAKPVDFEFIETPLADVAAVIAKKSGVNLMLDETAITDAGGSTDMPISRNLKGISLKSALRLTLHDHDLDYLELDDNVLLITTATKAVESVQIKTYEVGDLAAKVRRPNEGSPLSPLVDLVTVTIAPATWADAGGSGTIVPFESQLVVSQSREIHEQISELLAALRQSRDEPERFRSGGFGQSNSPESKILERLQTRQDFNFKETPLKDVVEALKLMAGVEIQLDAKAILDAGSAPDAPITFSGKGIRLDTALQQMLSKLELSYIIDHEVLVITSSAASKEHVVTKLYMVDDLLSGSPTAASPDDAAAYDNLIDTITSTVVPASWDDAGGSGSIRPFPLLRILVCDQTQEEHEQIAKLLKMLRSHRSAKAPAADSEAKSKQELVTRVYRLSLNDSDAVAEYLKVVERLVEPKLWDKGENYLGKVPGAIIARCSPVVHTKIRELLLALDALPPQPGKGGTGKLNAGLGGGGFGAGAISGSGAF